MKSNIFRQFITPSVTLLTSLSTLICCALPALLVTLGMGASLASFISIFPWIIVLSQYKLQIFFVAGVFLLISCFLFWKAKDAPCPSDPIQAKICSKLRIFNLVILSTSLLTYFVGFFFTFLATRIFFK